MGNSAQHAPPGQPFQFAEDIIGRGHTRRAHLRSASMLLPVNIAD
jgi:hypothetical protein